MGDTTTATAEQPAADAATAAAPAKPAGDPDDWKALARKWEQRAKENHAAADELARLKAAQMSELERAQAEAAEARKDAEAARVDALRYQIAAKYGITDNTDLILTGGDEDTMTRQAELWATRPAPIPKPDPAQGAGSAPPLNSDGLERAIRDKLGIS